MRTALITFFVFGLLVMPLNIPIVRRVIVEAMVLIWSYRHGWSWELIWNWDESREYVLHGQRRKV